MLPFDQKSISLDCETRHLNTIINDGSIENPNLPWEVAWIECKGNFVVSKNQYFIDIPNFQLSDLVAKLTHFDRAKYDKLKKPPEVCLAALKKVLYDEDHIIIGQNILKFDCPMLSILFEMCGEKIDWSFMDRIYDTRPLGLAYKNSLEKPRNGSMLEWQYKILNDKNLKGRVSQTALLKDLGIESVSEGERHSGVVDVQDTFNIFKELKKRLEL